MTTNATCGTTDIKSNISDTIAYILGCVEVRTKISLRNCNLLVKVEIFRLSNVLFVLSLKVAKYEAQKPLTCRATLFRWKLLSTFPVFHLACST